MVDVPRIGAALSMKIDVFIYIVVCTIAISWLLYYIWYIFWPVIPGKVLWVGSYSMNRTISKPIEKRLIKYRFQKGKQEYVSSRSGLYNVLGFPPDKKVGDTILISVCSPFPTLSCPRRIMFNFIFLLCMEAIALSVLYFHSFVWASSA